MASSSSQKTLRPLSPHLQIYRPQITSIMSILHRMTGAGLTAGLPVLVWWLWALAQGPETYARVVTCLSSPVGLILLAGWSWAFFYHLCTGVRHLIWDTGAFVTNRGVDITGRIALGVSTLLTILLWVTVL